MRACVRVCVRVCVCVCVCSQRCSWCNGSIKTCLTLLNKLTLHRILLVRRVR